ncbi:LAME_0H02520g1_1 [Lachancea meyersii CBS 8951]|uniref:LAME_0H02520g1_1 n=1 Tax=Lachancea meyersii CBS 8951 TaxID=1266667 RepID=A0A1G4KDL6_9SACH|nr:LAME_0H02520g1_1 [Lachancea meyersii CBS 8951]
MSFRDALKGYLINPEKYSEDIIFHDKDVVIVKDRFPKSLCHLLVLPRDLQLSKSKPWALNAEVKAKLEPYIEMALNYVFKTFTKEYELKEEVKVMPFYTKAQFHNRDYFIENFTQVGIHIVPSMNNLHVHVMTKDFHSERLKNKKHYNSFTTEFFVLWDRLPLQNVDSKHMEDTVIKKSDLKCCFCKANFKNRFSELKLHLDHEFGKRFVECSI